MGNMTGSQPESQGGIQATPTQQSEWPVVTFFFILYVLVMIRNAWISDDAYITLRTVDNFVHGHGLTWNTAERVQAYTHPLWMFCLLGLYILTREAYFTTLVFSMSISAMAGYLLAFRIARSAGVAILALACLTFSKACLDYSTSGLENPLTHLLLALFILVYCHREKNPQWFFRLSLIAALMAINRLDTLLFVLPALLGGFFQLPWGRRIRSLLLGFLPLIAWEVFAILYYGFPFPNTAYAKLNTGIASPELAFQGLCYLMNSLNLDPLTLLIILAGGTLAFTWKGGNTTVVPLAIGIALYLVYVICIGGDFMSGRFLSAALVVAVGVIASVLPIDLKTSVPVLVMVLMVGTLSPYTQYLLRQQYTPPKEIPLIDNRGIADERAFYHTTSSLSLISRRQKLPWSNWIKDGIRARMKGPDVVTRGPIGFFGYYAGPKIHVVDEWALADPLLTRLPMVRKDWRIGHFERKIPAGYLATLETGQNQIVDPGIAAFYDKLSLITRGPIFSTARLQEIVLMNLGWYDHLIRLDE